MVNTIRGLYNSFTFIFKIKYGLVKLATILSLFAQRKATIPVLISELISFEKNKDHVKFALMFALMNGTYKGSLCLLRRVVSSFTELPDKLCAPIAGCLAGLWIQMHDNKGQRNFIAALVISRLLDIFLNKLMQNAYDN